MAPHCHRQKPRAGNGRTAYQKSRPAFASVPSAASAGGWSSWPFGLGGGSLDPTSLSPTILTVLTVFCRVLRSLITLVPVLPSRRKWTSMPSARRKICARRNRPASSRGLFGQVVFPLKSTEPKPVRKSSEAVPVQVTRLAMISRTRAATGSASIKSSIAPLRFAWYARANVPAGQNAVSQAVAHSAKSAIRGSCSRWMLGKLRSPCATASSNAPKMRGRASSKSRHSWLSARR